MKIIEHTTKGRKERELSDIEVSELASQGDIRAKKEILYKAWAGMTLEEKVDALYGLIL